MILSKQREGSGRNGPVPYRRAAVCALALLLAGAAVGIFWFARMRGGAPARAALTLPDAARPTGSVHLKYLPGSQELAVTETFSLTNREDTDLERICLRFHAGAYAAAASSPAAADDLFESAYPAGFSPAAVRLDGCWADDRLVPLAADAGRPDLLWADAAVPAGVTVRLQLRLTLTLPACAHLFGRDSGTVRLIQALPVPAARRNGGWDTAPVTSYAAPQETDYMDFAVTADLPDGWRMVTGTAQAANQLAIVLLDGDMKRASAAVNGTDLTVWAPTEARAARLLDALRTAYPAYARRYGALPLSQLNAVSLSLPDSGLSAPGLLLVNNDLDDAEAAGRLTYWLAGQWFGWALGADSYRESWLTSAARQWAAIRVVSDTRGAAEAERLHRLEVTLPMRENLHAAVTPGMPADSFPSLTVFRAVMDGRAAALLDALDVMTDGRMDTFLADLVRKYRFTRVSRPVFEAEALAACGVDIAPLMTDWLDTYMIEKGV